MFLGTLQILVPVYLDITPSFSSSYYHILLFLCFDILAISLHLHLHQSIILYMRRNMHFLYVILIYYLHLKCLLYHIPLMAPFLGLQSLTFLLFVFLFHQVQGFRLRPIHNMLFSLLVMNQYLKSLYLHNIQHMCYHLNLYLFQFHI